MSYYIPEGSVAYDTAYADEGHEAYNTSEGTVPYFSTIPYKEPGVVVRSPKQCIGNNDTCRGFKCKGTEFCVGHLKAQAAAAGVA